jgi:predicted ATPase/DNA-binding CsgD family transcriptional regulator
MVSKPETSREAGGAAGGAADAGGMLIFPRKSMPGQHIPSTLTTLVGRQHELATTVALGKRPEVRLLTLTGPGGVGKTRLASSVGLALEPFFPDGVVFVSLATVGHDLLVTPAIAQAMGVTVGDERTLFVRLTQSIGDQRLLLILDNFEHVIGAGIVIAELLSACPHLKVMTTSRMPLHILGEQEFAVPPLNVPAVSPPPSIEELGRNPAVNLFVQRATAVKPDFVLTQANGPVIAEICARLDGLPLAIELAAARIKILTPSALLARLSDRLTILTGGAADLPERLRTMVNAISWSYDLLSPAEQRIFRRLSVFSGGISLEAVERIALVGQESGGNGRSQVPIDILDAITSLVDKSLILRAEGTNGEPRFRMLEVIREFGLAKLREVDAEGEIRRRFVAYYMQIAEESDARLIGEHQIEQLALLDAEIGNLRAALFFATGNDASLHVDALRIASGLWRYWLTRGHLSEGLAWLRQALSLPTEMPPTLKAEALNNQGNLCMEMGSFDDARALYEQSRVLFERIGDNDGTANEMNNIGLIALIQGRYDEARAVLNDSLKIRQDRLALPATLSNLGDIALFEDDLEAAERYHMEALDIRREISNTRAVASSCHSLGSVAFQRGDLEAAKRWFRDGMRLATELGDATIRASIETGLGRVAIKEGDLPRAMELFIRSLKTWQVMGSRRSLTMCFDGIAIAASVVRHDEAAAQMVGAAIALRGQIHMAVPARMRADNDALIAALTARLGDEVYARNVKEGALLSQDQSVELAMSLARRIAELGPIAPPSPATRPKVTPSRNLASLGLTRREQEVLMLLAQGLADKEIAEALFISPRTAMTHVGNILTKLGVSKRTQAVNLALRHGLGDFDEDGARD